MPRVSSRAQNGGTALMYAARRGHGGVLTALLEAHANTEVQDKVRFHCVRMCRPRGCRACHRAHTAQNGRTALMYAAERGHGAVLTALLEAHASTEVHDEVRRSAVASSVSAACARR